VSLAVILVVLAASVGLSLYRPKAETPERDLTHV